MRIVREILENMSEKSFGIKRITKVKRLYFPLHFCNIKKITINNEIKIITLITCK